MLSVAPLIGEAITRIHRGESVGALFSSEAQRTQAMPLWVDRDEALDGGEPRTPSLSTSQPASQGERQA